MTGNRESGSGEGKADGRDARPLLERLGMAAVAAVLAVLFGGIAAASWSGGEGFLAVMAGAGAAMTLWAGARTLRRG